jgi:ribosomal protein S18 acetylase RimI-like enzyme
MEVRRARPEDAAAIAAVHVRTWQAAYEHVFGAERLAAIDPSRREQQARRSVEDAAADVFVAVDDDGAVVGFVSTTAAQEGERELQAIYVLPEAWGTAAGRGLMDAAVQAMAARGADAAVLWVLEDNPRARRFYEREGWEYAGPGEAEFLGQSVPLARYRLSL